MISSCRGTKELAEEEFRPSSKDPGEVIAAMDNYQSSLQALSGKARAVVSEPGNTERVNLTFFSNKQKSLVTIRSGIGMEGGELLTDGDTLLIYNKIDAYVRKISIREGRLDHINRLASLNILDMISYRIDDDQVAGLSENRSLYRLKMKDGAELFINKDQLRVQEVRQSKQNSLPYSRITYDGYGEIEGFVLPRRISIFGTDGASKIALQVRSLNVNPTLDSLTINYPDDIPVYNR